MKQRLLFVLLFFCTMASGQNTETDSLKKLLPITPDGPQRVLLLENLSYAYVSAYPDTALQYAMEGLQLAQTINDAKGEAFCTNALGNVYFSVGDYPKALELYFRSIEMKEQLKNQERPIAVTYFNIANVYTEQQEYEQALTYVVKAKKIDEKTKDSSGIMFDLYSLASIYLRMSKPDSALYYNQQAYRLVQVLQDDNMIGAILNNYGEIYAATKQLPLALQYYYRSIPYVQAINDQEVWSSDYFGLAKVFKQREQADSAVFYARQALAKAQEGSFLKQVLEISAFLTDFYKEQKQYDSAFHYQTLNIAAKDSLYSVEKIKKVQNLKLLEQQRQQTIETAKIKYRNKIKLYIVIAASAVFLLLAFIFWRNNRQKQKTLVLLQQQQDETERQKQNAEQAYNELQATQAQLVQKEKMASLGELMAGIAHEIQNPLNFVNNFSELSIEMAADLVQEVAKGNQEEANALAGDITNNLQKVVYHGKRADSIVKSMLQHSRTTKGDKEWIAINALIEEYLQLAYHGMRARDKNFNALLETHMDITVDKIKAVQQDIGRVLLNLFNNAFYAIMEKKKQQGDTFEPTLIVRTKSEDESVMIRIKDNGNGIPQAAIAKIFQPFYTTKPTGQGTGLGLSLSYDIIKAHGGDISVETKEGEGSEFIIQLPIS